jgi:hypothetical protein
MADTPNVASVTVNARTLPLARGLAVALLVTAIASIAVSLAPTTSRLLHDRRTYSRLPPAIRAGWIAAVPFRPELIAFYADHLRPGDTFYVQAPQGATLGGVRSSLTLAAGFALLPHLMVDRPADADVVLSFNADPRSLHLKYAQVDRLAPGIYAARVARAG